MHKIKTVLRLAGLGLSQRQIAVSCQVGQATVSDYLRMATAAGLKWPDIADWDQDRLRTALTPGSAPAPSWRKTDDPDFGQIRRELQTHKHLTLQPELQRQDATTRSAENCAREGPRGQDTSETLCLTVFADSASPAILERIAH